MTVSNAYNRPDKLSPALRNRVFATAKRLGYSGPDPLAATLRRGLVGAFGLLFDDPLPYAFTDPAAVLFFEGIAAVCEEERVGLVLVPSRVGRPEDTDLIRRALVDGFIAYCDVADDGRLDLIEERGQSELTIAAPPVRPPSTCSSSATETSGSSHCRSRPTGMKDSRISSARRPPATTASTSASPGFAPPSPRPASTGAPCRSRSACHTAATQVGAPPQRCSTARTAPR